MPLSGDWDADGTDSVGLYDPSNSRFYLIDTLAGGRANYVFGFGPNDMDWFPLIGDWTGVPRMRFPIYRSEAMPT